MHVPALEEIASALGEPRIRRNGEIPRRNWADSARLEPVEPLGLVLPETTGHVSTVLSICHRHAQPVVTQGGLTGLAGGAHPGAGEIALSLERMTGIEEVDAASSTLTALAGTPLQVLQQAAEDASMTCGIDLGARGSCTIGGNVATNAGGNQVLRYGMTRRNVLGLEVVTADGSVVRSLNKMTKNNTGYDWTQLFIGSEGTLGVITRVTLALHPHLFARSSALIAVDSTHDAIAVLRRLEQLPAGLLVFEAMWREFYDIAVTTMGVDAPLHRGRDLYILVEAPSPGGGDHALEDGLSALYAEGLVADAVMAKSVADRRRFWALRESVYDYHRHFPPGAGFDISIPLDRMAEAIESFRADLPASLPGVVWVVFGHLADSNIHLKVMPAQTTPAEHENIERLVYARTRSLGGSISAEHGIGRIKRPYLALSRSEAELQLMKTMKRALDPKDILNRGRVLSWQLSGDQTADGCGSP
jgi:FAD/FMN-containing dehydrogenase